jgi:hypothetical protein
MGDGVYPEPNRKQLSAKLSDIENKRRNQLHNLRTTGNLEDLQPNLSPKEKSSNILVRVINLLNECGTHISQAVYLNFQIATTLS